MQTLHIFRKGTAEFSGTPYSEGEQGCEENGEREKKSSTICEGIKICGKGKGK
jgi:hypothetical protein